MAASGGVHTVSYIGWYIGRPTIETLGRTASSELVDGIEPHDTIWSQNQPQDQPQDQSQDLRISLRISGLVSGSQS